MSEIIQLLSTLFPWTYTITSIKHAVKSVSDFLLLSKISTDLKSKDKMKNNDNLKNKDDAKKIEDGKN